MVQYTHIFAAENINNQKQNKMRNLNQFVGIYPVSKTLRFQLKPIGRTEEWIQRGGIIEDDEQKALDYPTVKKLIDEYHKVCISKALNLSLIHI